MRSMLMMRSRLLVVLTLALFAGAVFVASPATAGGGAPSIGAPTISGSPREGVTLTVIPGTNSGGAATSITYQWQGNNPNCYPTNNCWNNISGATSSTYAPTSGVKGYTLRVSETASNSSGSSSATSAATSAVASDAPSVNAPTISGSPREGVQLNSTPGSASDYSGAAISISYQWQYNSPNCYPTNNCWYNISGATSRTYTPTNGTTGDLLRLTEIATNIWGSSSVESVATSGVASDTPSIITPTISGSPREGVQLTVIPGAATDQSGAAITVSYQWQYNSPNCSPTANCWYNVSGATASTYIPTSSTNGDWLRMMEIASNTYGSSSATSAETSQVAGDSPSTSAPTISGSPREGLPLTANRGADSDYSGAAITVSYQWQYNSPNCFPTTNCWYNISGAVGSVYIPTSSTNGDWIRVTETATNAYGSSSATSAETSQVAGDGPRVGSPTVSGTVKVGWPLQATAGATSDYSGAAITVSYQWQYNNPNCFPITNCWFNVSGATASFYIPTSGQSGYAFRVIETASNVYGASSATSTATSGAGSNSGPGNTTAPTISGTAQQGDVLTASSGSWSGSPTSYTYQWQDCDINGNNCGNISGATSSSYTVATADSDYTLRVEVKATNSSGSAYAISAQTTLVNGIPVNTALPSISGSTQIGQTLTVGNGSWSGSPTSYTYQWERCALNGNNSSCSTISGATASTYTPVAADLGDSLVVIVFAGNGIGYGSAISLLSTQVLPSTPANLSGFQILNSFTEQGNILTISASSWWSTTTTTFAYQWQDCNLSGGGCTNISGATSDTYTLAASDVGDTLDVVVTATNSSGSASSVTAGPTSPVLENGSGQLGIHPDHGPTGAGDPVNVVTGNVYSSVQDMELKGRGPAVLWLRTYNSQAANAATPGPMGEGWTLDYETSLTTNANGSVTENDPTGAQLVFAFSGSGTYTSPVGDTDILTTSANANTNIRSCATAYCLDKSNGVQWQFNSSGQLTGISDINGNALTLSYTGPRLTSLTNASGRVLAVAYNSAGYISAITNNSDGDEVSYGYTGDELTSVTSANANAGDGGGTTQYVYNSAGELTDIETPAGTNTNGSNDPGDDQHFTYNSAGQALTSTASDGEYAMTFYYNTPAAGETEVKDANGNISTYTYNSNGEITSITDPYGHQLQYGWNSTGEETSSTDQNGDITTYSYDGYGNLLQQVDPPTTSAAGAPSETITYSYEPAGSEYDGITDLVASKTVTQTAAVNDVTTYCYDTNGSSCPGTSNSGNVGDLLSVTSPNANAVSGGPTTTYTYDGYGDVLTETTGIGNTDGDGGTTEYCYNTNTSECSTSTTGNLISETTGYGSSHAATTSYTYNGDGTIASETDPDLNTTSYTYDADGNTTEISTPAPPGSGSTDETVQMQYDPRDNLLAKIETQTAAVGSNPAVVDETEYTYNPENQLLSTTVDRDVTGSSGGTNVPETTTRTYNNEGSLSTTVDPVGNTTTYAYDDTQELTTKSVLVTPASGSNPAVYDLTQYTYYPNGQVQTKEDGDLKTTTYYYNPNGTLAEVSQPPDVSADAPEVTTYTYDLAGNRLTTTTPDGNTTGGVGHVLTYTYDADGNVLTKVDSLGDTWTWTYDNSDEPSKEVDANGQETDYAYDPQGQAIKESFPGCAVATAACTSLQWDYDGDGNVLETQDASGVTTFIYDGDGNLTSETLPSGVGGGVLGYTYNLANQRISETEPNAAAASTYTYDEAGDLMSATDGSGAETAYGYTADGQLASVLYPNDGTYSTGAGATYTYGPAGQTLSVTNTAAGGSTITSLAYGYDADLNVVSITDQNNEEAQYTYDALERLTSEISPANFETTGTPVVNQSFGYDADGNRTSLTVNAGDTTGAVSSTYNYNPEADELATTTPSSGSTTTYCYDDDGQLQASTVASTSGDCTTGTISSFSYDPEGNLVGAGGDTYLYDAAGDRVSETESGVTTTQVFDPDADDVIQQTVGAGGSDPVVTDYEYGANGLVSADSTTDTDDTNVAYYGEDALGSVIDLTSAAGTATDEYAYDAFGVVLTHTGTSTQPFGYLSNEEDTTTGLDDFNAREYNPSTGSFLSEDPVAGLAADPQSLDSYVYGGDNPFSNLDPDGTHWWDDVANTISNVDATVLSAPFRLAGFSQASIASTYLGVGNYLPFSDATEYYLNTVGTCGGVDWLHFAFLGGTSFLAFVPGAGEAEEAGNVADGAADNISEVTISRSSYPEAAGHIDDAQAAGYPDVLTLDKAGADAQRADSLRGFETQPGLDRDEYPPAISEEGGTGASVRYISPGDNRGAGASMGFQLSGVPDGSQFRITTVP